ncbi:MAG: S8 family serine peptidase, partial [Flavobacteriales bacterium]|nr:S8 family serine peptidase [Flavobacteriales bacterium]
MRKLYRQTNGAKGAFVVSTNASWGIDGGQPANAPLWCAIYDSLGTEGILSCGATANQSYDVDQVGDLPTACPSDFMVSVTATNAADNRTFSAWGATTIDVGAPGDNVYTTSLGGGYGSTSGTSFASPFTAGVIGLLYSAPCTGLMDQVLNDPAGAALYVRQALFDGVEQVGNLSGDLVTGGRINVNNSLQLIMNDCGSCPTPYGANVEPDGPFNATFSWNSTGAGPFTVQYRPVGSGPWETMNNVINTAVYVVDLQPCVAYEFQVEAACDTTTSGFGPVVLREPPVEPVPTIALDNEEVFCAGDQVILTSSATTNLWSTGETTASIIVDQTGSYSVQGLGACDTASSAVVDILVIDEVLPVANDVNLPGPGTATLTALGDSILWYDMATGGSPIGSGSPWDTPFLNATTDFWCTNTETFGGGTSYGGATDNTVQGQYHGFSNNHLLFTANDAFTIRSVKVYANGAGTRPIALIDMDNGGANVAAGSFNLPDGESRVQLDFQVPGPGNYGLRITNGDPQLWRDGLGSNPPYPFALGTLGTLTGTTVTGANST